MTSIRYSFYYFLSCRTRAVFDLVTTGLDSLAGGDPSAAVVLGDFAGEDAEATDAKDGADLRFREGVVVAEEVCEAGVRGRSDRVEAATAGEVVEDLRL